jgi:predicted permease
VLPVFGVIAFGYVCAWTGLLRERVAEGVSDYVYTIAIPLLIFRTLSEAQLPEISPWGYWLVYFAGAGVAWTVGQTLSLRVFGRPTREAIIHGFTSGQSNIVLVGIPLVLSAFGEPGAVPLFLLVAVNLPLMMTTASLMMEATGAGLSRAALFNLLRNLVTNLILIAFVAGIAAQFLGVRASGAPKAIIDLIAQSSVPCALFAMGLALRRYGIAGDISMTAVISVLKLMVHPFVVWLLVRYVVPLPPVLAGVAVLFASMPCGINAYLLAERYRVGVAAAAGSVSLSTSLSILSISFWLWMIGVGVN